MGEKAYRQWWADDACPPHDPFLLERSYTLADEGLWQEEKCVWRLLSFKGVGVSVYRTHGFSEHSYCILCRWGGRVATRDQLRHEAEEDMKVTC